MLTENHAVRSDRKAKAGQRHRDQMAKRSRRVHASVADIGDIPVVVHPHRKRICRDNLLHFLQAYFPNSTGLGLFSVDHIDVIQRIEDCILQGGRFVNVVYRGFAKTTIGENASIWAGLYGHRRLVPLIGADATAAKENLDSIKTELETNDLLFGDFPEVCHPVRCLEGKPQRCHSQTYRGQRTRMGWTADEIVLATIPGSPASGVTIRTRGLQAAARGMKKKNANGEQVRPDFVIIDDPQTDESATSEQQINKRLKVIKRSLAKSGGHNTSIAMVINATVIAKGDMIEQLLDQDRNPIWQGKRIQMVRQFSEAHETHWLGEYAQIRRSYNNDLAGDRLRAEQESNRYYERNREVMDAGAVVSWKYCFDSDKEISAIQHAYNCLIDEGEEVFASEYQNDPLLDNLGEEENLTADQIAAKTNGLRHRVIPTACNVVTIYIDVQQNLLYYAVTAWEDCFTGYVVDYGAYPDQRRKSFTLADSRLTLAHKAPKAGVEGAIFAGLTLLTDQLLSRPWKRDDGAVLPVSLCLIDSRWQTKTIKQFCRQCGHANVMPAAGVGLTASNLPFAETKKQLGTKVGHYWRIQTVKGSRDVRTVQIDTNYWKSFLHARLAVAMGDRGCLSLFGSKPETHRMIAEHLTAEYRIRTEGRGRVVDEWKVKPHRPDNHLFDCVVGAAVAASVQGVVLPEAGAMKETKKKKISLAKLHAEKFGKRRGR